MSRVSPACSQASHLRCALISAGLAAGSASKLFRALGRINFLCSFLTNGPSFLQLLAEDQPCVLEYFLMPRGLLPVHSTAIGFVTTNPEVALSGLARKGFRQ